MASIPDELDATAAAPLLCAGITTFNALRNAGATPGDVVAIQGIGGLGHLAVQFARRMGFHTVAIARGKDKEKLALELGAHRYIDSETQDAAAALMALGGAKVILATVTSGKAMTPLIDGLGIDGTLLVVGASPEPIEVNPFHIHWAAAGRQGLAVGHVGRFRGHAALQRADRRGADDRDLSADQGGRSLSAHAERQGPLQGCARSVSVTQPARLARRARAASPQTCAPPRRTPA